jgi:glucosyl-3-phosphoglycerate synthase
VEAAVTEFAQNGAIVTLHRLGFDRAATIEAELEEFARTRRIALVLPCLYEELSRPALRGIVEDLRHAHYLDRVVVSLGRTPEGGFEVARKFFAGLPQRVTILSNDSPRLEALYSALGREGLDISTDGKGRAYWIGCGYLLACGDCDVIAAHDCDITTYGPELLARLCYPLAHPELQFEFVKGYYARVGTGGMHGRVTRLFVTPLLRAVQSVFGPSPVLTYLDSFRYPLAGEFGMTANLAQLTSVPADWGLEIGMLTEVYNNCELTGICQTELCDRYDHKHKPLGDDDCESGLLKMCVDTGRSLLGTLAEEGVTVTAAGWRELVTTYRQIAYDMVGHYFADAAINGLAFARAREEAIVSTFCGALKTACERHVARLARPPLLPGWAHVTAALPDFRERLIEAVDLDSALEARASCGMG